MEPGEHKRRSEFTVIHSTYLHHTRNMRTSLPLSTIDLEVPGVPGTKPDRAAQTTLVPSL